MNIIIDVEPAEINGSGSPVGGTKPVTTEIFKSTWIIIIAPIPTAKKNPNLSLYINIKINFVDNATSRVAPRLFYGTSSL